MNLSAPAGGDGRRKTEVIAAEFFEATAGFFPVCSELQPGHGYCQVEHEETTRTYKIFVPDSYTGDEPFPLVIDEDGYSERFAQFSSHFDRALQVTNVFLAAAAIHQGV